MAARLLAALALLMGAAEATGGISGCVPAGAETVAVAGCRTTSTSIQCDEFPSSDAPSPGVATLYLDCKRGRWDNATTSHCCVKLHTFSRNRFGRGCDEGLSFGSLYVGWAVYTNLSSSNRIVEVHILKNVSDLNAFRYDSSDDRFWDFSSPAFIASSGSLETIHLSGGKGTSACKIALDNIYHLANTSIKNFYLSNNWRNSTNLRLGQMPNLKRFILSRTSLQHFPEDAHAMMPGVEALTLKDNVNLRQLPANLSLMRRLEQLVVSGNALATLGTALQGLHYLRSLDATRNHLQELPQLHLLGRATLYFSHNRVRSLPHCSSLAPRNRTLRLILTGNRVSSWEGSADMLRCVKTVNLSHNALATLSDGMVASLDSVEEVDLRGNPVDCGGCPLERLRTWLQETGTRVQPLASGEEAALVCARPPPLAGQPVSSAPRQPGACDQPATGAPPLLAPVLAGLAVCGALLLATAACYRYRFKMAYTAHLLALRRRARTTQRHAQTTGADHFLFDAFILYSGSDRPWVVGTLVPLLENGPQRYRICLHERDFQLGPVSVQKISSSMDRSRHTIVVLSKSFLSSKCLWEMDLANHRTLEPSQREFIILLELEPLERSLLPRHLRFLMDTPTYLEWHQPADEQYEEQAFCRLTRALGPSCFTCSDSSRC